MSPVFFKGNRNIKPEVEEIFEEYLEDIEEDEENTENSNNNVELSINDNIETTNNTSVENELSTEFINIDENLNINENTNNTVPENISNTFIDIEKLISNINNPQIEEETNTDSIENKFQDIKSTFNEIEEIINNNKKNDSDSEINTNKATSNINNNYGLNIDTTNTEIIDDSFDKSEINLFDINLATAVEQNLIANYINQPTTPTPQDFDENLDVSSQESHTFDFNQKIDEEKVVDVITNFEENIDEKIQHILEAAADNENLIISEKHQKIYLPYKISELVNYMDSYPNVYSSLQDVVKQEFILPFDYFMKHPYKSRFSETYNIIKNREGKNVVKAFCYSLNVSKRNNLNPAVIAACKSLNELETYLYYLDSNNLKRFKFFNIIYEVNLA